MNFLIGADPELFVTNQAGDFISAHNLIPGTKSEPFVVPRGAVQVDGTAAEYNINPTKNVRSFLKNIRTVQGSLSRMIRKVDKNLTLTASPVAYYDKEYFDSIPDAAKVLGCDPDFNAWQGGTPNPTPDNTAIFRTGSGHVHIGWTEGADISDPEYIQFCCRVVKNLDATLGIGSLFFDTDNVRRRLYGKAGAFRPKPYGLEYRVLSNAWLRDENLMRWVFNTTQKTLNYILKDNDLHYHFSTQYVVPEIINNNNLELLKREFGYPWLKDTFYTFE